MNYRSQNGPRSSGEPSGGYLRIAIRTDIFETSEAQSELEKPPENVAVPSTSTNNTSSSAEEDEEIQFLKVVRISSPPLQSSSSGPGPSTSTPRTPEATARAGATNPSAHTPGPGQPQAKEEIPVIDLTDDEEDNGDYMYISCKGIEGWNKAVSVSPSSATPSTSFAANVSANVNNIQTPEILQDVDTNRNPVRETCDQPQQSTQVEVEIQGQQQPTQATNSGCNDCHSHVYGHSGHNHEENLQGAVSVPGRATPEARSAASENSESPESSLATAATTSRPCPRPPPLSVDASTSTAGSSPMNSPTCASASASAANAKRKPRKRNAPYARHSDECKKNLEAAFIENQSLTAKRADELAKATGITPMQVRRWFENRRCSQKRQKKIPDAACGSKNMNSSLPSVPSNAAPPPATASTSVQNQNQDPTPVATPTPVFTPLPTPPAPDLHATDPTESTDGPWAAVPMVVQAPSEATATVSLASLVWAPVFQQPPVPPQAQAHTQTPAGIDTSPDAGALLLIPAEDVDFLNPATNEDLELVIRPEPESPELKEASFPPGWNLSDSDSPDSPDWPDENDNYPPDPDVPEPEPESHEESAPSFNSIFQSHLDLLLQPPSTPPSTPDGDDEEEDARDNDGPPPHDAEDKDAEEFSDNS